MSCFVQVVLRLFHSMKVHILALSLWPLPPPPKKYQSSQDGNRFSVKKMLRLTLGLALSVRPSIHPSVSQWAGAYFWLDELSKEVRWYPGHQGQCGNNPQCSDKSQNSGFFRKSIFCVLGGP